MILSCTEENCATATVCWVTERTECLFPMILPKMLILDGSEDLLLVTQAGILIRTHVENVKITSNRATQGVIVMRFKEEGDQVIAMALTDKDEEE